MGAAEDEWMWCVLLFHPDGSLRATGFSSNDRETAEAMAAVENASADSEAEDQPRLAEVVYCPKRVIAALHDAILAERAGKGHGPLTMAAEWDMREWLELRAGQG